MSRKPERKVRPPTKKIAARRGEWTADVEGRELAVLHNTWREGPTGYHDPMKDVALDGKKYRRLVEVLSENDVAVMQRDAEEAIESRDSFIGLFSYKDLEIGEDGSIRLSFVDRVQ